MLSCLYACSYQAVISSKIAACGIITFGMIILMSSFLMAACKWYWWWCFIYKHYFKAFVASPTFSTPSPCLVSKCACNGRNICISQGKPGWTWWEQGHESWCSIRGWRCGEWCEVRDVGNTHSFYNKEERKNEKKKKIIYFTCRLNFL